MSATQQNNIIESELVTLNNAASKHLGAIIEMVDSVRVDRMKQYDSFQVLSTEYWQLLKTTKTKIKTTKDAVNTLLGVCEKWNEILLLQNSGSALNKNQKEYISSYVTDECKEYFAENFGLDKLQNDWCEFNKKAGALSKSKKSNFRCDKDDNASQSYSKYGLFASVAMIGGGIVQYIQSKSATQHVLDLLEEVKQLEERISNIKVQEMAVTQAVNEMAVTQAVNEMEQLKVNLSHAQDAQNKWRSSSVGFAMIAFGVISCLTILYIKKKKPKVKDEEINKEQEDGDRNAFVVVPNPSFVIYSPKVNQIKEYFAVLTEKLNDEGKYELNLGNIIRSIQELQSQCKQAMNQINVNQNNFKY